MRILTGIQPSGALHLGNYFGAMRPAIELQTQGEAFYRGELAEKIEAHARANGGAMTRADLAEHANDWVGTISQDYRG